jgi:hypothetical protein
MICNQPHPDPRMLFRCELEDGHKEEHRSSTIAAGLFITWPTEAQRFTDALADLVKGQF